MYNNKVQQNNKRKEDSLKPITSYLINTSDKAQCDHILLYRFTTVENVSLLLVQLTKNMDFFFFKHRVRKI